MGDWLVVASLASSVAALGFGCWAHGYRCGVIETERRWSDAVKRAGLK